MRILKPTFLVLLMMFFIISCDNNENKQQNELTALKNGKFKGRKLRVNEVDDFSTLFPPMIDEAPAWKIAAQVFEGLVALKADNISEVVPGLAKSYAISEDGKEYTFKLRENVLFHENECFSNDKERIFDVNDVIYTFERLCDPKNDYDGYWVFKGILEGLEEYRSGKENHISGLERIDDFTLKIRLNFASPTFLKKMCYPSCYIYPKEAFDFYKENINLNMVGTGPFQQVKVKPGSIVVLKRNEDYYLKDEDGNQLPYLDGVEVSFIKDKKTELLSFRNGELDAVFGLPSDQVDHVLNEFQDAEKNPHFELQSAPAMSVEYLAFQHKSNIFKDVRLRKAFNYAIDKRVLVNQVLQGEGAPAINGFVPPSFDAFNANEVKGYNFDPEKARALLSDAGYPEGVNFPSITLVLNSGGKNHEFLAEAIQKMLEDNLNVKVKLDVRPWSDFISVRKSGAVDFWRAGWVADYPDPETFLLMYESAFVPKNDKELASINEVRYQSARFDSLLNLAKVEMNTSRRMELLRACDQQLMDDAVVMPLIYQENIRLVASHVHDLHINPMEFRDLKYVYFTSK